MEVKHTFQVPSPGAAELGSTRVEVSLFRHLAGHALPAQDTRREVMCSVPTRGGDGGSSEVKLRVRRHIDGDEVSAVAEDDAAEGRAYLERHGLEGRVHELLQAVLKAQPGDPYRYMVELLKEKKGAPLAEADAADAAAPAVRGVADAQAPAAAAADAAPLEPAPPAGPPPASPSPRKAQLQAQAVRQAQADIGGFYVDPNHLKQGTFAGTRMVSSQAGSDAITLVGSDDGSSFWSLFGKFTAADSSELVIDFSPKGGPKDLKGHCEDGRITFEGGNFWTKVFEPDSKPCQDSDKPGGNAFGGLYTDPHHFKQGSFAGTRMVSDLKGTAPSDDITLVGSDDGLRFWTLSGKFTSKQDGSLEIDFSPKGGPKLSARYVDGSIKYEDGNAWLQTPLPCMMAQA